MTGPTEATRQERDFDPVAGLWKFACALAVLVGHNLVTITSWRLDDGIWTAVYRVVQFFSPLHFFFFSGFLAAGALLDASRSLRTMMTGRALRIYVLVVAALAWGLLARATVMGSLGIPSLGTLWPLPTWDGELDLLQALRHLNPLGFADHVSFNYAVWYLYQEFRLVLLFPVFRWLLLLPGAGRRLAALAAILVGATILEYLFWSWFPLFRSSPFQTLGYAGVFLAGSLVWMELRPGGAFSRIGSRAAWSLVVAGLGISYLEAMGFRPPMDNPVVLLLPTLVGQSLLVVGLSRLWGKVRLPLGLRRACDTSVGIYIVHPPIHMLAAWMALRHDSLWPVAVGIVLSIAGGFLFHAGIEKPSQSLLRRWTGR